MICIYVLSHQSVKYYDANEDQIHDLNDNYQGPNHLNFQPLKYNSLSFFKFFSQQKIPYINLNLALKTQQTPPL